MKKNYKTKVFCRLSVMRVAFCSILLLSLNAFWISSSVYGQQNVKRISLKQEQVSVLDALREINRLSDNMVVFKKEEVEKETKRVTIDLKDVTVLDAVKACVESTNLTCVEYAGRVVVTPKKEALSLTITGVVRDDKGEPLPGATIVLKTDSLQIGTSADVQGAYRLTVPTSATTLVFSFM